MIQNVYPEGEGMRSSRRRSDADNIYLYYNIKKRR